LSLERDEEEEAEYQAQIVKKQQAEIPSDVPPQLLFVHLVCSFLHERSDSVPICSPRTGSIWSPTRSLGLFVLALMLCLV
jgi:hypothetical protein